MKTIFSRSPLLSGIAKSADESAIYVQLRHPRRPMVSLTLSLAICMATSMGLVPSVHARPGPFYWIIAQHSGKALMPENHSKEWGARIVQMPKGNFGAQHWKIRHQWTDSSTGQSGRLFQNRHSKYCISAIDYSPGTTLRQDQCETGGGWREWIVNDKNAMWNGQWVRFWNSMTNLCLDISNVSVADYAPAAQYYCVNQPNQMFRVEYVPGT